MTWIAKSIWRQTKHNFATVGGVTSCSTLLRAMGRGFDNGEGFYDLWLYSKSYGKETWCGHDGVWSRQECPKDSKNALIFDQNQREGFFNDLVLMCHVVYVSWRYAEGVKSSKPYLASSLVGPCPWAASPSFLAVAACHQPPSFRAASQVAYPLAACPLAACLQPSFRAACQAACQAAFRVASYLAQRNVCSQSLLYQFFLKGRSG